MRREYPDSPVASVGAVIFCGEDVLLVRRRNEPSKDLWGLPGGVVKLGERVEDAIVREVEEETNILVKPLRLLAVLDNIRRDDDGQIRFHYILTEFRCAVVEGELRASTNASDARWIAVTDLDLLKMSRMARGLIMRVAEEEGILR
ncbi:MAG: NUDIX hydrolase [Candidatus Bathyarchaeota archaeon]|nr:MAG: NUDIX hydrolase [Candidatus Bathyarchaeota archaeon]